MHVYRASEEQRREFFQLLSRDDVTSDVDSSEALRLGSLAKLAGNTFSAISNLGSLFGGG